MVNFIGREKELAQIDTVIKSASVQDLPHYIYCINAPGGVGKTRLIKELRDRYLEEKQFIVLDIIDFADDMYHIIENIWLKISELLDKETFNSYIEQLNAMQESYCIDANIDVNILKEQRIEADRIFADCFNSMSKEKRIILFFDTTDALFRSDFIYPIFKMANYLENVFIFIAGRNAKDIGEKFLLYEKNLYIKIIELPNLRKEPREIYFREKEKEKKVNIPAELKEKLLILSDGKPILIDLAVEWIARNIPFDWLKKQDDIQPTKKNLIDFEKKLMVPFIKGKRQLDPLILFMAHVYPVDKNLLVKLAYLMNIDDNEIENLYQQIEEYVFVKFLPDGKCTLHDEMRRMINEYAWPEIDPDNARRSWYSESVKGYLDKYILQLEQETAPVFDYKTRANISILKGISLYHTLYLNIDNGLKFFSELFNDDSRKYDFSYKSILIDKMEKYKEHFNPCQFYDLTNKTIDFSIIIGDNKKIKELSKEILSKDNFSEDKKIEAFLSLGNAEIRLGNLKNGIFAFQQAVDIAKKQDISDLIVKSLNALGWSYRLIGDIENAIINYHEARRLCIETGLNTKALKESFCWISNNLAFVLSYSNKTCSTAIDIINKAIQDWKEIGNETGKGAAYLVLGVTYYRSDRTQDALDAFDKALRIFEPLKYNDWLGQIYSWRGALYQNSGEYRKAEEDLKQALAIGSSHIEAMTLNRLARVDMARKNWDDAKMKLERSLELSKKLPDYMYWLGGIERLAIIAVKKGDYGKLEIFEDELAKCLGEINQPERNSLGMVYLALARLAFGQNDIQNSDKILYYLQKAFPLLIEYSTYARTGVIRCLDNIENDFREIDSKIIRQVGKKLKEYVSNKEIEDIAYGIVTPVMYKWASWE